MRSLISGSNDNNLDFVPLCDKMLMYRVDIYGEGRQEQIIKEKCLLCNQVKPVI